METVARVRHIQRSHQPLCIAGAPCQQIVSGPGTIQLLALRAALSHDRTLQVAQPLVDGLRVLPQQIRQEQRHLRQTATAPDRDGKAPHRKRPGLWHRPG